MANYCDKKLRFWCQKVLPLVYDDSLSYYELLCKVVDNLNKTNEATSDLISALVEPYSSSIPYKVGDYVWNNDKLYKCIAENYGNWNTGDWEEAVFTASVGRDVADFIENITEITNNQNSIIARTVAGIAVPYDESETYSAGAYVTHIDETGAIVYKSNKTTTGTFNTADWDPITLFPEVLEYARRVAGVVQTTGSSLSDVMSQNATTLELLARIKNMGTLPSGNLSDITIENSLYALTSSNTYPDYPDSTVLNGFILTVRNVSMWAQLFISYTTQTSGSATMGKMWYRSGSGRNYNPWKRINTTATELANATSLEQTTGNSTTKGMSQNAISTELETKLSNLGSYAGDSISAIGSDTTNTAYSSIYTLLNSNTYTDYPDDSTTEKYAFVETIRNNTMWEQTLVTFGRPNHPEDGGNIWYRSGINVHTSGSYTEWQKLNVKPSDLNNYGFYENFPGSSENPIPIITLIKNHRFFSTYLTPEQTTTALTNINTALMTLVFGTQASRGFIGIQRNKLALIVGVADSSADVVKNATAKLTSYNHKLAMFGDSITAGRDGGLPLLNGSPQYTSHTFAKTIARNLGIVANNFGVGSQGWLIPAGTPSYTAYQKVANTAIGDFTDFTLAWGVNDYSTVKANNWELLGDYNSTDESTLIGQMYKTISYIYTQVKRANVIIIAPWNGTSFGSFPDYKYATDAYGHMWGKMKEFCNYYMLPYIEMSNSPLNSFVLRNSPDGTPYGDDRSNQMIGDGVHPTEKGYIILGQWLAGEIAKIIG